MITGRPPIDSEIIEKAVELYKSGISTVQIARMFPGRCSEGSIKRALNRKGITLRPDSCRRLVDNEGYFEKIDTPDKAYWLGFLATDGNISDTRICINIIDKEHLEKFRDCICGRGEIRTHFRKTKDKELGSGMFLKKEYFIYRYQFRSKKMVADLATHGILPQKTFTVKPWNGPSELMSHYWRGCVDGDGGFYVKKDGPTGRFILNFCGNSQMVEGFKNFCYLCSGYESTPAASKNIFTLSYGGVEEVRTICGLLYGIGGTSLDRKQVIAELAIKTPGRYCVGKNRPDDLDLGLG
jgi:hypothetical protein